MQLAWTCVATLAQACATRPQPFERMDTAAGMLVRMHSEPRQLGRESQRLGPISLTIIAADIIDTR